MRKEEYIQEVISRIENKKAKAEVEIELSNHIDDRISYYTDAGWDEETANEKAVEHMGSPEKVSEEMSKLHKGVRWFHYFLVLPLVAVSLLTYSSALFSLLYGEIMGALSFVEPLFVVTLLLISLFFKKRGSKFLTFIPIISFVLFCAEYLFFALNVKSGFASPVIVSAVYTVLGRFKSIYDVYSFSGVKTATWLTVISAFFYIVIFVILVINWNGVKSNFSRIENRLHTVARKTAKVIVVGTAFFGIVILSSMVYFSNYSESYDQIGYSEVVLFESDKICDIAQLSTSDNMSSIVFNWDWNPYLEDVSIDYFWEKDAQYVPEVFAGQYYLKKYDGLLSHKVYKTEVTYEPRKDYIYNFVFNGSFSYVYDCDYRESNWKKTDREYVIVYTVDQSNEVELTIKPKE